MSSLALQITRTYVRPRRNACMSILRIFCAILYFFAASLDQEVSWAGDIQINGPELKFEDNQIRVTTSLALNEKWLEELRNGVTKELKFTIDLFRVWKMWPDEFVSGRSITRTLKGDPVTLEYRASSNDGTTIIQKKFKSFESMIQWALLIEDLKIANIGDLEKSTYFVRVNVESKIRKLPPVIGYFMIFLPENEFNIQKDSPRFSAGIRK